METRIVVRFWVGIGYGIVAMVLAFIATGYMDGSTETGIPKIAVVALLFAFLSVMELVKAEKLAKEIE